MNTSNNSVWNKRLPSFLGVLFLFASIGTIGWLGSNAVLFGTKAAGDGTPKNVKVSNISDTAFTVSFVTDASIESTVSYGTSTQPNFVVMDDRDQKNSTVAPHTVHHITITKLNKGTKYFFIISSGDKTYLNNSAPYEVTTATSPPTGSKKMSGKINNDDGTTPAEAIAYATLDSRIASGLVDASGQYSIDLSVLGNVNSDTILNLLIVDATKQSKVSLSGDQVANVPLITLSKNYDFLFGSDPLEDTTASGSADNTPVSFPVNNDTTQNGADAKPQILSPTDDQQLKDQQPLFRGTALPNEDVQITIESDPINVTVKSGNSGNWQYRPDTKLAPGNHTITIKTLDAEGIIKTITQSFVVYAEGSQFTEPSVSPSQPTPTTGPTLGPVASPTPSPTVATPTPSAGPTAATEVTTSPTQAQAVIPVTGNTTLLVSIIGIVSVIGIGALLFFLAMV